MADDDAVTGTVGARRGGRGRWVVAGVGVLVVALATAWIVVGLTPRLAVGYFDGSLKDPEAHWAESSIGAEGGTSVVTNPSDGTNDALWSFRNDGPFPVEVSVVDAQGDWHPGVRLFVIDPTDFLANEGMADDSVRLAPGDVVGVLVSVGFGCAPYDPGTSTGTDRVDLRVTTLGISRTVTAQWPDTIAVETTTARPGDLAACG